MAYILFLIGILTTLVGGVWVAQVLSNYRSGGSGVESLATLMVAAPGFGVVFTGLLILAAGEALVRLASIERHTNETRKATLRLVEVVSPSE